MRRQTGEGNVTKKAEIGLKQGTDSPESLLREFGLAALGAVKMNLGFWLPEL